MKRMTRGLPILVVALLISVLSSIQPHTATARAQSAASMGTLVAATPPIHLPADAAMHPSAHTEWWYCTGRVADAAGHTYGIDVTFIKRFAVQQYYPDAPYDALYRDDVAITDEAAHRFHSAMTFIRPAITSTVVSTQELEIRAGPISMSTLPGTYRYQIHGSLPDGAIDLTITAARPPLYIGGGLIPWGLGYSYYYSFTQLQAVGTITLAGRPRAVQGTIWMDHQWGTWPTGDMRPVGWTGWQWMGMRLADGTNIDLTNIKASGGAILRGAAVLHADNSQTALVPGVVMTPLGTWRSPTTHILYPSGWRVQIPLERLDVSVYPTVRDQEFVYGGPPADYLGETTYWEGDSVVVGRHAGHAVQGAAYTELMGYGWPPAV